MQVTARAKPSRVQLSAPEWWERTRDHLRVWASKHAEALRIIRLVWLMCCAVGLLALLVAVVLFPNARAAVGVYVGVAWILLCWFVLARTRTLTVGAFTIFYGVCIVWSVAVGLICLRLTALVTSAWPVYFRNADTIGPAVAIAAVAEESLKLLPIAVLAVAAPSRVRRFAAVDWLLVGGAAGAAFLCVEEVQRRLSLLKPPGSPSNSLDQVRCGLGTIDEQIDCYAMTRFGLNPFGAKPTNAGVLDPIFGGSNVQYAGQHVMTALVAAGIGIGIVVWRASGRLGLLGRVLHRVGAVGLPLLLFWVAIADHVVLNAESKAGANLLTNDPYWLKPSSTIAIPFRWWYHVGGHGEGRAVLLLGLLVVGLLCDASRASLRDWWAVVPTAGTVWADRLQNTIRRRLGGTEATSVARPLRAGLVPLALAAVGLAYVVTRDLRVAVLSHSRGPGESRREAMLRGRAVLVMQREARELAAAADAGTASRWVYRAVAAAALAVLLVLALVVAPHAASTIGYDSTFPTRWLAGLFDGLAQWWNSLSGGQQLLLTVALALLIAIPFGFGAGLFLAGGLTYLAAHGEGVASLLRDPRAAIRDYFANRSLGGMGLDAGEFALTFVPAGLGSAGGVAARTAARGAAAREAELFLSDPAAWRAARVARERGELSLGFLDRLPRINGMRPRGHALAGKTWHGEAIDKMKAWPDVVRKAYPNGIRYSKSGFADFSPYATRTERLVDGFTGLRRLDERLANQLAGLKRTPDHFTWHHVEDGHTMQLVPSDLHQAVPHTGGHAIGKP